MPPDPQAPASAPVPPVEAWAAMANSGVIALGSIYEERELTQEVADELGWRVVRVRIVPLEDV